MQGGNRNSTGEVKGLKSPRIIPVKSPRITQQKSNPVLLLPWGKGRAVTLPVPSGFLP